MSACFIRYSVHTDQLTPPVHEGSNTMTGTLRLSVTCMVPTSLNPFLTYNRNPLSVLFTVTGTHSFLAMLSNPHSKSWEPIPRFWKAGSTASVFRDQYSRPIAFALFLRISFVRAWNRRTRSASKMRPGPRMPE